MFKLRQNTTKKLKALMICLLVLFVSSTNLLASNNVSFSTSSDWGSGFVANIKVTNATQSISDGWQLEFDFAHKITNIWGAKIMSHSDDHYVIKNETWNGKVSPGASVSFGFQGTPGNVTTINNITSTLANGSNPTPELIAKKDTASTDINTAVNIYSLSNDVGKNIQLANVTQPTHGTSAITGNSIIYTPETDFYGNDTFAYTAKDSFNQTSSATVYIVVNKPIIETYTITASSVNISSDDGSNSSRSYPVFIQPMAGDSLYMIGDKISFNGSSYESVINYNSWSPLAYPRGWKSIINGGGTITPNGKITVNEGESKHFTITPNSGSIINDVKVNGLSVGNVTTYVFNNITKSHTIIAEFKVAGQPVKLPVANNDSASVSPGVAVTINALKNDTGSNLVIRSVTTPQRGSIAFTNSNITYISDLDFSGNETFKYTITDSNGNNATGAISILVTTPPVIDISANSDLHTTYQDTAGVIDVLSNDIGNQITINNITQPDSGTAAIENGKVKYTPNSGFTGNDSFGYIISDSFGQTATASIIVTVLNKSQLNNAVIGYWEAWNVNTLRLKDISKKYNVICVAFGVPADNSHVMTIHGLSENDKAPFKSDIKELQAQGKKVLLSIGGAADPILVDTQEQRKNFISSLIQLIDEYNFDGLDIDIETSSLILNTNDIDFKNPTTPRIVNLIDGVKKICTNFSDKDFMLTAAPETTYFQPNFSPSTLHGAYLPILHALRDQFTFIHPQFYNSGSMYGGDGQVYLPGTADFLVALSEPLITGFYVRNPSNQYTFFEGFRADQIAFGLLSTPSEGSGYMQWQEIKKALDYITKGISFEGKYVLQNPAGYPTFRGVMTWSINCDKRDYNYAFANNAYKYFFGDDKIIPTPTPTPTPAPTADGYYHTSGNQILDSNNNPIRIEGINWFGFEAKDRIVHGLWSRNYKEMMDQMKEIGFNTIRLPYNNEMFEKGMMPSLNYWANHELEGLTPIQVMDKIVDYAGIIGLKIILDHHRSDTLSVGALGEGLWYTDAYPESRWISDWKMLAERYNGNPTVIGADIHNEPHNTANWGQGGANDWKTAAEKCGNEILSVNPNWLILVEGIENYNGKYYWWGGNLKGVKDHPITLNVSGRLVYSPHIYPNSIWNQPWFSDPSFPNNLFAIWDELWGFIYKENIAPIIIGEFGSKFEDPKDILWLNKLASYLNAGEQNGNAGISWLWWSWNPNSGDTGGILKSDWNSVEQEKMDFINTIRFGVNTSD